MPRSTHALPRSQIRSHAMPHRVLYCTLPGPNAIACCHVDDHTIVKAKSLKCVRIVARVAVQHRPELTGLGP